MLRYCIPSAWCAIQSLFSVLARCAESGPQSRPPLDMSSLESRVLFSVTPLTPLDADGSLDADSVAATDWLLQEDYDDGVADDHQPQSGNWSVQDNRYRVEANGNSISTFVLDDPLEDNLEINVTINANPGFFSNAFIIFDYQHQSDFKFAGAYVGSDQWVIGHYDTSGWQTDAQFDAPIQASTDYELSLRVTDGSEIELYADGSLQVSHSFTDSVTDGQIGLGSRRALSHFDDLSVGSPSNAKVIDSNVFASVHNGHLVVTGDATGELEILAQGTGSFQILDHGNQLYSFEDVSGNLKLQLGDASDHVTLNLNGNTFGHNVIVGLGGGDDYFLVTNGSLDGNLVVRGGDGHDVIDIQGELNRNVFVHSGIGNDTLSIDAAIGRHLRVSGGEGEDDIAVLSGTTVGRHAHIRGGAGNDAIAVHGEVERTLSVYGGTDNDTVSINATIGGNLKVNGGQGEDSIVVLSNATVGRHACIKGGADNDSIVVQGEVERSLFVYAGAGDDVVSIEATIGRHLKVNGGQGEDDIAVLDKTHVGRHAWIRGGTGNDSIQVHGVVDRTLAVCAGAGNDTVSIDATIGGHLWVSGGSGEDDILSSAKLRKNWRFA